MKPSQFVRFCAIGFLCVSMAGCGSNNDKAASNDLKQLTLAYVNYHQANGKPATKMDDLTKYLDGAKIDGSRYVIVWGYEPPTPLDSVIAYEADTPTKGGLVALAGGDVKKVTAEEFKTLPKATPKTEKKEEKKKS